MADGKNLTGILLAVSLTAVASAGTEKDAAWWLQTNRLDKAASVRVTALPDVLILGDSISVGYTPAVRKKLAGVANVTRPGTNCGPSQWYLANMKQWVGTNRWAVIHVNFGIWDNHYLKGPATGMGLFWGKEYTNAVPPIAKGTAIRGLGYRIRTPIKEYEKNLRTVLGYLKEHSDKVVFGLTTPLTGWQKDDRCGRIRVYNELAEAVCAELGVAVDDLYAVAEQNLDQQTDGCHFSAKGYDLLADAVVAAIRKELEK